MRRKALRMFLLLLLAPAAYLAFWPTAIAPVAWNPPNPPPRVGVLAPNAALARAEWLGKGSVPGPEATVEDAQGRIYTGTSDGRIVRLSPDGKTVETIASTGGRPLGVAFAPGGDLVVCDAVKGLLTVSREGKVTTLATEEGGRPFGFTDDVDVAPDGTVYFTDASSKFGKDAYREDILEHGGNGRFLAYRPDRRAVDRLIDGLQFSNGVALNGDASFVVVNETGSYRMLRYWLAGPKRGTWEVFLDDLPGFPDNVTYSKTRKAFWVALFAPRDPIVDFLAPHPRLRRVVDRLPLFLQPAPPRVGWALAVDEEGRVIQSLEDPSPESFSPVTSVREHAGKLYLGSLLRDAVARVDAP